MNNQDDEDLDSHGNVRTARNPTRPASPPPPFHSRSQSPAEAAETTALAESFDAPSDDDDDDEDNDMRNVRGGPSGTSLNHDGIPMVTQSSFLRLPVSHAIPGSRRISLNAAANDGVFANLSAKPTVGSEKPTEEHPPVRRLWNNERRLKSMLTMLSL